MKNVNTQRSPRKPRWIPATNTMTIAKLNAAHLTSQELLEVITPAQNAFRALREGVATELQWAMCASAMNIALRIETQGVVRGLYEHLHSAELCLCEIYKRGMSTGTWLSPEVYLQEIDTLATAIDLHHYQIEQLSAAELRRAVKAAVSEVSSSGNLESKHDKLHLATQFGG
jgi:hypothetical protein